MKLVIRQVCLPDYRRGFFDALSKRFPETVVISGGEYFSESIRTIEDSPHWLLRSRNRFFLNRRFVWLRGDWSLIRKGDTYIHELNPRIISLWRDLLICRWKGARFLFWGHAWGKAGPEAVAFRFRHWLASWGDGLICYTESQAALARKMNPRMPILAAPNACCSKHDCLVSGDESLRDAVIYVGRLVEEKKVELLLTGFAEACRQDTSFNGRLIIVGDGPKRGQLEQLSKDLNVDTRVTWMGHQSNLSVLRNAYAQAFVSVSAGYVGLSLTQSFAFGVPALISKEEPHSPEIEAAQEGKNSRFFDSNNATALGCKILEAWREWRGIDSMRREISSNTAERYTFEVMADRIVEMMQRTS